MYTLHQSGCWKGGIISFYIYPEAGLEIADGHGDAGVELLVENVEWNAPSNLEGNESVERVEVNSDSRIVYGHGSQVSAGDLHSIKPDGELCACKA
ncbi:hypothetical protein HG530_007844 [Fusarium avenaceum]|nr:hypothetical protein HG530_007844 [Fusarium avenaceum]